MAAFSLLEPGEHENKTIELKLNPNYYDSTLIAWGNKFQNLINIYSVRLVPQISVVIK